MPPLLAKRCALSVDQKIKILECIDEARLPKTEIAKKFGIPKSTLFTILKNKDSILNAASRERMRMREGKFPLLEKGLLYWLKSMRSKNVPVDGNDLKVKATIFFEKLYPNETFKASDGWLQNFKIRHEIKIKKICDESSPVNKFIVNVFKKEAMKKLMESYSEDDVFNATETALFYKLLPDPSLVFNDEDCKEIKRAKQKITLLLGSNMSGSEKLPLFVIGNSQRPLCFKGLKSLPVTYRYNKKAWMTGALFEEWIRTLDEKMTLQNRRILLIVDNCSVHSKEIKNLNAIKVEFLPPTTTSELQPMNQGVIHNFKKHYRKKLIRQILFHLENNMQFDVNLLIAVRTAEAAWQEVSRETIRNCFQRAGFNRISGFEAHFFHFPCYEDVDSECATLLQELSQKLHLLNVINFCDYTKIDDSVQCTEEITEDNIIESLLHIDNDDKDSSDEDINDIPKITPTTKQAAEALRILRDFFENQDNGNDHLENINHLENAVFRPSKLQQNSIIDFFPKS